jgi:hypothetical protein
MRVALVAEVLKSLVRSHKERPDLGRDGGPRHSGRDRATNIAVGKWAGQLHGTRIEIGANGFSCVQIRKRRTNMVASLTAATLTSTLEIIPLYSSLVRQS